MNDSVTEYRLYADGAVVHQDDFADHDHAIPFYDDYQTVTIPDAIRSFIEESAS
mgnify:FL=1|jgi:hypothetical protein